MLFLLPSLSPSSHRHLTMSSPTAAPAAAASPTKPAKTPEQIAYSKYIGPRTEAHVRNLVSRVEPHMGEGGPLTPRLAHRRASSSPQSLLPLLFGMASPSSRSATRGVASSAVLPAARLLSSEASEPSVLQLAR